MVGSSSSSSSSDSEDNGEPVLGVAVPRSILLDDGIWGDMNRDLAFFSVLKVKGVTASMMHCVLIGICAVPGWMAREYLPILLVFIRWKGVMSLAGDEGCL